MSTWLDNNVKNLRYAPFIKSDALANLPASAPLGALFVSTDTFAWYRYNGAGWDLIGGAGVGDITGGGTVGELAKFTGARVVGDAVAGVDYVKPSALAGYVPYTGATANVNLGAFNASANTFISDNYQAANVGGVSVKNALGQTVALMGAGNSQGTTFNGQANGTTFNASQQLIFGGSTTQDQFVRTFNSASTGRKGLNLSDGATVDMKIYTGGDQTLGNFQEGIRTMVIGTGLNGGGGSLENILFHSTNSGNLFALSVPQNRAYMYLPFSVSGELTVGGDLKFSGSSGGLNLMYYSSNRFYLLSYFDTITIQGGVNDLNKRQIDFNTGATLSAYIDINGVFWKGASSTPIADSDNSLKFATTAFVKNQGYITSSSLNGYVPYTGATANVNLGAFDILANDGLFSGQVGIGLSTAQQAGAKLEIDGGDIFMRNGYSVGFSSGTSGSTGGGATMIGRAIGNNTNNGYAEFLSFYAGESLPYTAPIVLQNNGGNVLIGTTTNTSGFKLQIIGATLNRANGVVMNLDSINSNAFKLNWRDATVSRGFLGADSNSCLLVGDTSGNTIISTNNTTGLTSISLKSGVNGEVLRISRSAGAYSWGVGVDSGTSNYNFYNNGGTSVANINNSTGAYTATSDRRLKKNIALSGEALPTLMLLNVCAYDWNVNDVHEPFGLIAQDVHEVIPQYVYKGDENANWGIAKAEFVPMLIKAIQELQQQVTELKTKIYER